MQLSYSSNRVIENVKIEGNIYKLVVEGDFRAKAGQFYNLRAWEEEPILSRPISINDCNEKTITFLYEVKGRGTEILMKLRKDDGIELLGPLGNSFEDFDIKGKIAVVTGGIGIAPMLYAAKRIGTEEIDLYAGFRDKSYITEEFKKFTANVFIATDNGAEGHRGYVTDLVDPRKYDMVLCCGPEIMMNKIVDKCREANVTVLVSKESYMACGIGACLVCSCKTTYGMKRTCKDGPIFRGEDVI